MFLLGYGNAGENVVAVVYSQLQTPNLPCRATLTEAASLALWMSQHKKIIRALHVAKWMGGS